MTSLIGSDASRAGVSGFSLMAAVFALLTLGACIRGDGLPDTPVATATYVSIPSDSLYDHSVFGTDSDDFDFSSAGSSSIFGPEDAAGGFEYINFGTWAQKSGTTISGPIRAYQDINPGKARSDLTAIQTYSSAYPFGYWVGTYAGHVDRRGVGVSRVVGPMSISLSITDDGTEMGVTLGTPDDDHSEYADGKSYDSDGSYVYDGTKYTNQVDFDGYPVYEGVYIAVNIRADGTSFATSATSVSGFVDCSFQAKANCLHPVKGRGDANLDFAYVEGFWYGDGAQEVGGTYRYSIAGELTAAGAYGAKDTCAANPEFCQ